MGEWGDSFTEWQNDICAEAGTRSGLSGDGF